MNEAQSERLVNILNSIREEYVKKKSSEDVKFTIERINLKDIQTNINNIAYAILISNLTLALVIYFK